MSNNVARELYIINTSLQKHVEVYVTKFISHLNCFKIGTAIKPLKKNRQAGRVTFEFIVLLRMD